MCSGQNLPSVSSGTIERLENFRSKFVTSRHIDVWMPKNYNSNGKYAVLYMHDGQMLYDSAVTWNRQAWDVDDIASKLMNEGKVEDFIVVGIWNGGETRHSDYFPQKAFEALSKKQKEFITEQLKLAGITSDVFQPVSDNYLKFLVTELKPFIDKNYAVYTDLEHTFVAGSSMGGLISMYAICEYPHIFGGAACLSTHWPGIFTLENNPIPDTLINYLNMYLPDSKTHKLYFDYGDQTLDELYPELQKKADKVIKEKGYTDKNWITNFYPGHDHSERSWRSRLHVPLEFLLKK